MNREEHERLFRKGLSMCKKGRLGDAALVFRRLLDGGSEEPLHLSYCGLLTATVHGDRRKGLQLCERALQFGIHEPEVVINLARVYQSVGSRLKAVKLLRNGLRQTPGHPGMQKLIDQLSPRAKPPLSMIERNHPLNKGLAIMMARLRGKLESDERKPARPRAAAASPAS